MINQFNSLLQVTKLYLKKLMSFFTRHILEGIYLVYLQTNKWKLLKFGTPLAWEAHGERERKKIYPLIYNITLVINILYTYTILGESYTFN